MTDMQIDIFNDHTNFLLKYLARKKNRTATFDKLVLKLNGIDTDLKSFIEDCSLILQMGSYITTIYSNDTSIKLQLTQQGFDLIKFISYEKEIVVPSFIHRAIYYVFLFFKSIIYLIAGLIGIIIAIVWTNKTGKAITLICAILGALASIVVIYEWLKK